MSSLLLFLEHDTRDNKHHESHKDGQVHDEGANDAARWTTASVANREQKAAKEDETLQHNRSHRIVEGHNQCAKDQEVDVLQEVDLASLRVVHLEPVCVAELFGIVAIASVWVAELRGSLLSWEGLLVLIIELRHELTSVDADASAHSHEVHREDVLENDGQGQDQAPEELFGERVLVLRDTDDLHLSRM